MVVVNIVRVSLIIKRPVIAECIREHFRHFMQTIKATAISLIIILAGVSCTTSDTTLPMQGIQHNRLNDAEKQEGWKLLFNGRTTAGWRNFNKNTIGSKWTIEGETLHYSGKDADEEWHSVEGGDIVTNKAFENFELSLEWKLSKGGNSGVMYYVVEGDQYDYAWQTGPEMQILDQTHPDAAILKHRAGDLYDLIESSRVEVKPAGEWNHSRIVANDGHIEHWLNGFKIVEFTLWSEDWFRLVAGSKFASMPDFGKARRGHIALQDHGDKVWYRNIMIREW